MHIVIDEADRIMADRLDLEDFNVTFAGDEFTL
jgi:hypothetical protein